MKKLFAAFLAAVFFAQTAFAAAPAIPPSAPVTLKQTTASKLRQGYQAYRFANPHTPGVLASGVTLTMLSTVPVDLGKSYLFSVLPNISRLTGGNLFSYYGIAYGFPVTTLTYGGTNGNFFNGTSGVSWRAKYEVDAYSVAFSLGQTTAPYGYRIVVDGKYVSLTPTVAPNGGWSNYLRVDFGTPPNGRSKHEVWVEGDSASSIAGVYIPANGSVQPAPAGIKMTVLGDSITAATASPALAISTDGFANVLGDAFGVSDLRASGSGGQGFLNPASVGGYTLIQRMPYDVTGTEDVIVSTMGINDSSLNQTSVQTAVLAGLQKLRSLNPTALIIVFGTPACATGPSTAVLNTEASYLAAFNAWGDTNSMFVPVSNPASGQPMLFGTGNTGSPTSGTLTFTGALSSATSGTLTTAFIGPTNTYFLNFSDNVTQKTVTLTNGSTAVSWSGAVTASATATYYNSASGNSDVLVGTDGTHPSGAYAHQVMGFWYADALYNLLRTVN